MPEKRKVKKTIVVKTTPEAAFEALTQASELREWFSDEAWTIVRPDGRYDVRWNQGYRSDGRFTKLDPPRRATVTWQGSGEPGETKIKFKVKPVDEGAKVTVSHNGFGPSDKWDKAVAQSEKGWNAGLENLKSTLETGVDLRSARQPFLGIFFSALDAERAANEGIAADEGIYVLGTAEESGARTAGLGQGDVIVGFGGIETPGVQELGPALRAHTVGDVVDVDLVRGQERETVQVTLGKRPQAEVPDTAEELADLLAQQLEEVDQELKAAVEELTDEEAEQNPAEGEWSVKQVLAHLSSGERGLHNLLVNWAVNGWLDGGPIGADAVRSQLEAVLAVTPTLQGLLERYLTDEAQTVAFLRRLPEETVAHKARYRRIGEAVLYGPGHTREHIEQIKDTIAAVRGG
jgi:uncharacterized protein YndB with AHSA1/START domain